MRRIISVMFAVLMPAALFSQDRITGHDFATRSEVIARNGMAATSQPLATQVALDILKKGGKEVDKILGDAGKAINKTAKKADKSIKNMKNKK